MAAPRSVDQLRPRSGGLLEDQWLELGRILSLISVLARIRLRHREPLVALISQIVDSLEGNGRVLLPLVLIHILALSVDDTYTLLGHTVVVEGFNYYRVFAHVLLALLQQAATLPLEDGTLNFIFQAFLFTALRRDNFSVILICGYRQAHTVVVVAEMLVGHCFARVPESL